MSEKNTQEIKLGQIDFESDVETSFWTEALFEKGLEEDKTDNFANTIQLIECDTDSTQIANSGLQIMKYFSNRQSLHLFDSQFYMV